ncbi:Neuronal acetylcholine receptor subunit non-alpha-3 [Lamellibrachia satsuma]|nr:Neuronal acetylcholine receptor subunit non-alpha-3 [Lamellibrachia satsuma]
MLHCALRFYCHSEWTDERLRWQPEVFGVTEVALEAKRLWVPEFAVINGADEIYGDYREFRAIVSHSGQVRWEPGGVFRTMCAIDITYFPFDDQNCALVFGAWSYHTTKMNLTVRDSTVNLDSYRRNGEWRILLTEVVRDEFFYAASPQERFSNVAFLVSLRRRYTFYVLNVILPSMVTSVLLLSIFYCPPGQKVQIGVVVLLSFRIFLLNVTDNIPKTSDHIPLLGIYLTCTMALTTLSMVLTVLVLNLHELSDRPVPRWAHLVFLQYLSRLFCQRQHKSAGAERRPSTTSPDDRTRPRATVVRTNSPTSPDKHIMPAARVYSTCDPGFKRSGQQDGAANGTVGSVGGLRESGYIVWERHRERRTRSASSVKTKPDYSADWHWLATVVDRLFFWSFLITLIGISMFLFHPLIRIQLTVDGAMYVEEG